MQPRDLANALAFLHEHKAVHGNITPRNVLVSSGDKVTKLADLMLAAGLRGSKLLQNVADKKLFAELPYMAPEQLEPGAFVDQLADLYSLGAIVYFLFPREPAPAMGHGPAAATTEPTAPAEPTVATAVTDAAPASSAEAVR